MIGLFIVGKKIKVISIIIAAAVLCGIVVYAGKKQHNAEK
jgi:hypothetical protein